jgi:hypothetical protein
MNERTAKIMADLLNIATIAAPTHATQPGTRDERPLPAEWLQHLIDAQRYLEQNRPFWIDEYGTADEEAEERN